jgi:uncharacterized SAM-binding protein YcdF (DUF218 family)
MFVLKQFIKGLVLPPLPWIFLLLLAFIFWPQRWARKLLLFTLCLILALHSWLTDYVLRYPLESRYPPLISPPEPKSYDAIVVLTGGSIPATGLIPFPSIEEPMFRRLEEAWRLYVLNPKPIIVSGGHVSPFTPSMNENEIAREYLIRWGVPRQHVLFEDQSRDTFESALEVEKLLRAKHWKRYLLVTSAAHMPRSMLAFGARAPEPVPAPGDFSLSRFELTPLHLFPNERAAVNISSAFHEYIGLINYYWRVRLSTEP